MKVGIYPIGITVDPNTNTVYVANFFSNSVSIIDGATNKVTANEFVGTSPTSVAVNPRLHIVYVYNSKDNSITMFSPGQLANKNVTEPLGPSNGSLSDVDLEKLSSPNGIAVNSNQDINILYADDSITIGTGNLSPATDKQKISLGGFPTGIAVDPNTNLIYVTNIAGYISIIDTYTYSVVKKFTVGNSPIGIAVDPTTNVLYVTNLYSDYVNVINGTTDRIVANITVGNSPVGVAVNPDANLVYVTNKDASSDFVHLISTTTKMPVAGITANVNPANAGNVYCNSQKLNYTRFDIGITLVCEPKPNQGFAFSSWSGLVGANSSNNAVLTFPVSKFGSESSIRLKADLSGRYNILISIA